MRRHRFTIAFLLAAALLLTACAGKTGSGSQPADTTGTQEASAPAVPLDTGIATGIESVGKYGNIVLRVKPDEMEARGYEPADLIRIEIGDKKIEMPIGTAYSDVDSGEAVCRYKTDDEDGDQVVLAINTGNLASALGIAEIRRIDEDPGYECIWAEGYGLFTEVFISMAEKQGYAREYELHRLGKARTNDREDYADLSDAQYANFRVIGTAGMGSGALCRSSTPIDPDLNRNREADALIAEYGVRTIVNMTNSEETMKACPGYDETNYAKCDIIALNMEMDFQADAFREKLAKGLRFMAAQEGPYLIHCKEGKDRTGFAAAILECLMGASADEVTADYMLTYDNFYGIDADNAGYAQIAESNVKTSLAKAFGIDLKDIDTADLGALAAAYLQEIGLSDEEIAALKANLAKDYN